MKSFITSLVALLFGAVLMAGPAYAGTHKGYYYNAKSFDEIASRVDASLAKDATGNTLIAPEKCRRDGSCATAKAYLDSIQAHDPEAGITNVSQVAKFMRERLTKDCTVTGTFEMDYIDLTSGTAVAHVSGMQRPLRKGECVYRDKLTGRILFAEHCANPMGKQLDNPCGYVDFVSTVESGMHVAVRDITDVCLAMRDTTDFGNRDDGKGWQALPPNCGPGNCVNIPIGPGKHQIRFSPGNEPAICLEYGGQTSYQNQVRSSDMVTTKAGERHARIWRESKEIPKGTTWGSPKALAFWASTQAEADAMNASFGR